MTDAKLAILIGFFADDITAVKKYLDSGRLGKAVEHFEHAERKFQQLPLDYQLKYAPAVNSAGNAIRAEAEKAIEELGLLGLTEADVDSLSENRKLIDDLEGLFEKDFQPEVKQHGEEPP